jgi:8-oxo-dGTP pyrophosphatase MutT (NUDIX family)
VWEETGLRGNILEELGTIDYWFKDPHTIRVHKFVTFYLMAHESGDISHYDPAEVDAARWVSMEEAITKVSFGSEREILRQAQEAWPRHISAQG